MRYRYHILFKKKSNDFYSYESIVNTARFRNIRIIFSVNRLHSRLPFSCLSNQLRRTYYTTIGRGFIFYSNMRELGTLSRIYAPVIHNILVSHECS